MDNKFRDEKYKFYQLKEKKILIYGTGTIARRIIRALSDFHIVGVIDKVQFSGEIEGIPIIMWDEIYEGTAEAVIIASLYTNYKEIYDRIVDKCIAYDMKIFSVGGYNLFSRNGIGFVNKLNDKFYKKNEKELIDKIVDYEAISFDLFDTLIMRKNLEPADLFDLLENKVKKKGILAFNLKKNRRQAELLSEGGDIYKIYSILQQITNLSNEECDIILQEEIECEKQYIIPRKKMVEIMMYAASIGKRVNIITNMYLPANVLEDILNEKGIIGYEKIYVSCEYGVSKGKGLFQKYKEDVIAKNYLHIGDDRNEDIEGANKYGLNSYEIKSAYAMLKSSNLRHTIAYACNSNEKGMLGLLISELFNNPFALYASSGVVRISSFQLLGKIFVAPIVIYYMLELIDLIKKIQGCEGILFGSRDCYLFKRLYDRLDLNNIFNVPKIKSIYFRVSRKLCLKFAMKSEENIKILKQYAGGCGMEEVLTQILDIHNISKFDKEINSDLDAYYLGHKDAIIEKSEKTRENFYKYMDKCGISKKGKYILCEMTSQGTVQYALNQIFDEPVLGFYLYKRSINTAFEMNTRSCFQEIKDDVEEIVENNNFLESVLTSPEPSLVDMNENGDSIFASEERSHVEIEGVMSIQKGIESFFFEYFNTMYIKELGTVKQLSAALLRMHREVMLVDECEMLKDRKLFDDLSSQYFAV
nr:hypothetical protein [uncultured Schaedlerella sp.]